MVKECCQTLPNKGSLNLIRQRRRSLSITIFPCLEILSRCFPAEKTSMAGSHQYGNPHFSTRFFISILISGIRFGSVNFSRGMFTLGSFCLKQEINTFSPGSLRIHTVIFNTKHNER